MQVRRIHPHRIRDTHYLSKLFDLLLYTLENSPLQVTLRALSYDTQIPENVLLRLRNLHRHPEDASDIRPEDYHLFFSHILVRYPTVQLFVLPDGAPFVKL